MEEYNPSQHNSFVRLPLLIGYTHGSDLIVPDCSLCGSSHIHGNPAPGYKPGDRTTRAPHCVNRTPLSGNVCIDVKGEISNEDYRMAMRHHAKPSKKRIRKPDFVVFPIAEVGT